MSKTVHWSIMPVHEPSGWQCELFGCGGNGIVWHPRKGQVPNVFWRWMQYVCFGNKWKRVASATLSDTSKGGES